LDWLEEERAAWEKVVDSGDPKGRTQANTAIVGWAIDPDLAGVRDPEALAKLPEAEREEWQALWTDVYALVKKAEAARP
jgi:hypothetical protein